MGRLHLDSTYINTGGLPAVISKPKVGTHKSIDYEKRFQCMEVCVDPGNKIYLQRSKEKLLQERFHKNTIFGNYSSSPSIFSTKLYKK